jgi:hypothetical protein
MRELTDVHYPEAERIRVVLGSPSTHSAGALYQTFRADEARRVLRRLEFHYTPVGSTWWRSRSRPGRPMPRPTYRNPHAPRRRDCRLGEAAQCRTRSHQLDVHNRKSPHQDGPGLSQARRRIRPAPESQNLCDEVLVLRGAITERAWFARDAARSENARGSFGPRRACLRRYFPPAPWAQDADHRLLPLMRQRCTLF